MKCFQGDWPPLSQVKEAKFKVAAMAAVEEAAVNLAVAPYRICPLGAHIDHQGGPVTAMAINLGVLLGFVPSKSPEVWLRSNQFRGDVRFSINEVPARGTNGKASTDMDECASEYNAATNDGARDESAAVEAEEDSWGDLARGAVLALQKKGYVLTEGITGVVDGMAGMHGAGISSSAALGIALLLALEHANALSLSPQVNIELDREIENGYLGLRNGILDQSAVLLSRKDCLTRIHCRDGTHELVQPPWVSSRKALNPEGLEPQAGPANPREDLRPPYRILLAFSGLQHALALNPGYNRRVDECRAAAQTLLRAAGRGDHHTPVLANVSPAEYARFKHLLGEAEGKRAQHFFSECARVEEGVGEWREGDLHAFGSLMSQSGASSINNYECGCGPLIQLREILLATPGILGARFSGAGFRGCCVGFVERDRAEAAAASIGRAYAEAQPELAKNLAGRPSVILCDSAGGAHIWRDTSK